MLIVAHGFFVAGEFGIVAVDRARIEELAEGGDRRAASTLQAVRTLSFQLSGAQLGITVTSLIVGFLAEPTVARLLEPAIESFGLPEQSTLVISIIVALALATATEMVIGELVPKNLAIAKPLETALKVAGPLRKVNALLRPLIVFLNSAANWTVRRFGIEPQEELSQVRSLEEIEFLVRSSRTEGTLPEQDFSLLARSIALEQKTAADALTPRTAMVVLPRHATLEVMRERALESGHSRFPVIGRDTDEILGIVHIKDSFRFDPDERRIRRVDTVLQEPLLTPESQNLASMLFQMRRARKHLAVVVDEYGGTAGIITLEDILEEIVGDIEDEYDPAVREPQLTSPPEGIHVLSGMLHPDEVRDACGFNIPEGDYDTLAGFLLAQFDRIPQTGDHISHGDWEFKVTEMEGKRIAKVLVVEPTNGDSGPDR